MQYCIPDSFHPRLAEQALQPLASPRTAHTSGCSYPSWPRPHRCRHRWLRAACGPGLTAARALLLCQEHKKFDLRVSNQLVAFKALLSAAQPGPCSGSSNQPCLSSGSYPPPSSLNDRSNVMYALPLNPDGDADAGATAYQLRAGRQLVALIRLTIYSLLPGVGNPLALLRQSVRRARGRGSLQAKGREQSGASSGAGQRSTYWQARVFCFSYFSCKVHVLARAVVPRVAHAVLDAVQAFYLLRH